MSSKRRTGNNYSGARFLFSDRSRKPHRRRAGGTVHDEGVTIEGGNVRRPKTEQRTTDG